MADLSAFLSKKFAQSAVGFDLAELTELIERKTNDRRSLIAAVRSQFAKAAPSGGLVNLPLYDWKAIYTTNYDELVEQAYASRGEPLVVYSSNFDFNVRGRIDATRLYKLHGTLNRDISDGYNSRLVLTESDYGATQDYREHLYDAFKADLSEANLIIIGHSLADPDIKEAVERALALHKKTLSGGRITLLMYEPDADRALLYEAKGLRVVNGGIDEFFVAVAHQFPAVTTAEPGDDEILEAFPVLRITTKDVLAELTSVSSDVSKIFNGWPATYADIAAGLTFRRTIADEIITYLRTPSSLAAVLLGASGVGKTTASRQLLLSLQELGQLCWEHQSDHLIEFREWREVARSLKEVGKTGVLFVDDAHAHVFQIDRLIDDLVADKNESLKLLITSSRSNWQPRTKSPNLFRFGREFLLSRLNRDEIDRLLLLVDYTPDVRKLVESSFVGFSTHEKKRRLAERCEADMFVCMKNIFASENYDNIVLREFADLGTEFQEIYRFVAALETIGVRVHRQLIIRLLGLSANRIGVILDSLADIVREYTIDAKEHIYGWRGRHSVISAIITQYKFNDPAKMLALFDDVIANIVPTYDVEIRSINELCNIETGISRFGDLEVQNRLLRKMISVAPGQRVPRHRLIRNLIRAGRFEQAQTEIRIFDKDFKLDGPAARYDIELSTARALRTPGIMPEDRIAILQEARAKARAAIGKFQFVVRVYVAYCEVGMALFDFSGDATAFDEAISAFKEAEARIADPLATQHIREFEQRFDWKLRNGELPLGDAVVEDAQSDGPAV